MKDKSIIEKLGMKTPDKISIVKDVWETCKVAGLKRPDISRLCFKEAEKIKEILDQRNHMLEALIEDLLYDDEYEGAGERIALIESATGKSWEEVKKL